MGNWKHTSVHGVASQTEPTREPPFAAVPDPAQSCLGAMQGECLIVPGKMFPDFRTIIHHAAQILHTNPVRISGKEHNSLMRRDLSAH
ncbi:hypothetical protein XI00_17450 [Bradyrhizobium sp. CCBAU 21359]|nr:hypothetical protein [Bradyrhizobium sp. CCBAU 21359]